MAPPGAPAQPSEPAPRRVTKSRDQPPGNAREPRDEGEAAGRLARLQSVIETVGDRLGLEVWERGGERRRWRRGGTGWPLRVPDRLAARPVPRPSHGA